jgi:two-component system chemotaxis sensor kinase CheA
MAPASEFLDLFVQEATEMVRELEQGLILLERQPKDPAIINRVFRAVHTLKGNAGIVGLETLAILAHAMETLLDGIRKGRIDTNEQVFTTLLAGSDLIRFMVEDARSPMPADKSVEVQNLKSQLEALNIPSRESPQSDSKPKDAPVAVPRFSISMQFAENVMEGGHDPVLLLDELTQLGTLETAVAHINDLPDLRSMDVRRAYLSWDVILACPRGRKAVDDLFAFLPGGNRIDIQPYDAKAHAVKTVPDQQIQAVRSVPAEPVRIEAGIPSGIDAVETPAIPQVARPSENVQPAQDQNRADTVRVNIKVLDRLMTLAGEMVLTRNQLVQSTKDENLAKIERATQRVDLITAELQDAVMAARMQSIHVVFDKFQRSVRDLARDLGKRVRLVIDDEGVELDKTVIEAIADPMAHLVRNALDHGIETPERRIAAGKPPEGTLKLRAWHAAGQVIVDIVDDGRGIDAEQVKAKAVKMGIISVEEARALSARAARELIFRPGFTTTDTITQVSGRGVGLDIVTANLSAIGGSVRVESEPGHGCAFRIRLPLTLAIVPTLLVEAEGERFAIPQVNLIELVRVRAADVAARIERVGGVDVMRVREHLVPVVRLRDTLGIENPTFTSKDSGERQIERRQLLADRRTIDAGNKGTQAESRGNDSHISERRGTADRRSSFASAVNLAVIQAGDDSYGLVVDSMLDSIEIVVKPLGRNLNESQCYAGATVLGDGRAALILDVIGLGRKANISHKAAVAGQKNEQTEAAEIVEKLAVLLVEGGNNELFGVPLDLVERIRKVSRTELSVVGGKRVLRGTKTTTPVFSADEFFPASPLPDNDCLHVILFRAGQREYGLLASDVTDIIEIDADFDMQTHRQRGVCGSSILGDRVLLVLDLREMLGVGRAEVQAGSAATDGSPGRRKRLLVVEDSTFFLNHIAAFIEEAGYETVKAENGAIGLEKLTQATEPFDLIVTDIEMPEMDGFEMVSRIRKMPAGKNIPIVAVTSLLGTESRLRGKEAGINEYCVKLDREDVLSRINMLLSRKRPD